MKPKISEECRQDFAELLEESQKSTFDLLFEDIDKFLKDHKKEKFILKVDGLDKDERAAIHKKINACLEHF